MSMKWLNKIERPLGKYLDKIFRRKGIGQEPLKQMDRIALNGPGLLIVDKKRFVLGCCC